MLELLRCNVVLNKSESIRLDIINLLLFLCFLQNATCYSCLDLDMYVLGQMCSCIIVSRQSI